MKIIRIHFTKTSDTKPIRDIKMKEDCDYLNTLELLTPKTEDKILEILQKNNKK